MHEAADFEFGWDACPPGHALVQRRGWQYDRQAGLLFAPSDFTYEPMPQPAHPPSDDWVISNFDSFVRGEFSEDIQSVPAFPGMPTIAEPKAAKSDVAYEYLLNCESLVYGGYLDGLLSDTGDITAKVQAILADKHLGNPANLKHLTHDRLAEWLDPLLADQLRIRLVMPAFPFKDQNPFRTRSRPSSPDMADVAMLIQLHLLTQALYQVHPHGVDWVLLCDGVAYCRIFGIERSDALAYRERLREWRDWLNFARTVSIIDLAELVERADACDSSRASRPFTDTLSTIRSKLVAALQAGVEPLVTRFRVLKRGMAWNLNSRNQLNRAGEEELWTALKMAGHPSARDQRGLTAEIDELAEHAGLEYASFNLALRYLDFVNQFLPGALRATIHPKAGQIAAPRVGNTSSFPWNSVAVRHEPAFTPGSITLDALHQHARRFQELTPVIDKDTGDPFFFVPSDTLV